METKFSFPSNLFKLDGKEFRLLPDGTIIERYTGIQRGIIMDRDILESALAMRGKRLAEFVSKFIH